MSPRELIEQHKIYLEDLERWVVPLEIADEALQMKTVQELEQNVNKLQNNLTELNRLFNDLGNING